MCGQNKRPQYYREPKWEPPRDLAIPTNSPFCYAPPLSGFQSIPGCQSYYPTPNYNWFPNYQPAPAYQPAAAPSNFAPMLLAPSGIAQTPAMAPTMTPAMAPAMMPPYMMAQHPAMVQPHTMTHPPMMIPIPQAPQYYNRAPGYGTWMPPRY
ncbi:hypothetical protein F5Y10DRAFT_270633 [Nemania abortiva]|nr:hypothetical protein F5Y10DRAFT_270633 [Nemania abortiva]